MIDFETAAANELADLMDAATERECAFCHCTDLQACQDPVTGAPCHWVEGFPVDVCSSCYQAAHAAATAPDALPFDRYEGVRLYSPHEAQRFIEATRGVRL